MSREEDDAEASLVAELRALAGSPAGERFVVSWRGRSITVTHNAGSSSSVTLRARYDAVARSDHPALAAADTSEGTYRAPPRSDRALVAPRPLGIVLRNDAPRGLRTAYETGDRRFDDAVFVDTATTDREVLAAVLGPEVRAAVLALFELGFLRVTLDDWCPLDGPDVVEAYLWTFASREPPRERAARCLDVFVIILDHLPKLASSGDEPAPPKPPVWIGLSGWVGLMGVLAVAPTWWFVVKETGREDGAPQSIALLVAIASGLIASRVARPALIRELGVPQSGAFLRVASARIRVFLGAAALVFFAAMVGVLLAQRR